MGLRSELGEKCLLYIFPIAVYIATKKRGEDAI